MFRFRMKLRYAAITSSLILAVCGTVCSRDDTVSARQMERAVANVRTGKTSTARTEAAEHLAQLTRKMNPKQIDDKTVFDIVSLLDTSEDSVRYWVARSLGNLGPRAKVAIPKLRTVLAQVDCLRASKTSAEGIRLALRQMGVTPPPPPRCIARKRQE